jgi:phage-related protein (TIGR01555 family)
MPDESSDKAPPLIVEVRRRDVASKMLERWDSWANALTGIGTGRDKTTVTTFEADAQQNLATLEALYHNEDMAARICDEIPEMMLREGYEICADDQDSAGEVCDELTRLGASEAFVEGATWGRLYGGAAIWVGANDGQSSEAPLNEANIRTIDFLHVIDRTCLSPATYYDDPAGLKFGEPETYRILVPFGVSPFGVISTTNLVIHESRLVLFRGARTSPRRRRAQQGWDDSVLQRCFQILQMFAMNWASASQLMSDASQGVYKIKGLFDMLSGGNKDQLLQRMQIVDQTRSTARMLMVDADSEDFDRKPTPFAGIPDMLDRSAMRLAAAAGMPMTVLFGMSPGGLNATGESDVRGWYDKIASKREQYLRPRFERLIKLVMLAKQGPTSGTELENWSLDFPPLWQMTATEESEVRYKVAQADQIYLLQSVVTAEEIATSRFTSDGWSAETQIELKAREELMSADKIAEELGAAKLPDPLPLDPNAPPVDPKAAPAGKPAPTKPGGTDVRKPPAQK